MPPQGESVVAKVQVVPQITPVAEELDVLPPEAYVVQVGDVLRNTPVVELRDVCRMMGVCVVRRIVVIVCPDRSVAMGINVVWLGRLLLLPPLLPPLPLLLSLPLSLLLLRDRHLQRDRHQ